MSALLGKLCECHSGFTGGHRVFSRLMVVWSNHDDLRGLRARRPTASELNSNQNSYTTLEEASHCAWQVRRLIMSFCGVERQI